MNQTAKISKLHLDNRSDEELMCIFIDTKNDAVFSLIYQRHFVSLSKYLTWLTGDTEQGKDIVQNIFLKIHNKPFLFNTDENFKVWLFIIAKNQWKNALRNKALRKRKLREFSNFLVQEPQENSEADSAVRKKLLNKAINELSDNHKEIIVLKYSNNLRINEISEVLKCSEGTVKSRLFFALNNLKDLIKK